MASGRFLSTSIAEDDRLSRLSITAEFIYIKTIPHLDRDGMISGKPGLLYSKVCPLREELFGKTADLIDEWVNVGLVMRFQSEGGPVLFFPGFAKNNNLPHYHRERASRFPAPPGYTRSEKGLQELVQELVQDSAIDKSVLIDSEDQDQDQDQGRESARAQVLSPEPTNRLVRVTSPHLDPRHFSNGYIPSGTGINAVEVYYERFSINQDSARLNAIKEDDLMRHCPDIAKLRDVVTAYSRTPFQLGNVQLILDWYRDGIPEKHTTPDQARNGALGEDEKAALKTAARLARSSIETARKFKTTVDPSWEQTIEKAKNRGVM
jgi:hypothetical protein